MRLILAVIALAGLASAQPAGDLEGLVRQALAAGGERSALGVTRQGLGIPVLLGDEALRYESAKTRVLLIGGVDGADASVRNALETWEWFHGPESSELRQRVALAAVPVANPHAWLRGGAMPLSFPPSGPHYQSEDNVEAQYLWRWVGLHAPDLAIVLGDGPSSRSLVAALRAGSPADVGAVPAILAAEGGEALAAAAGSAERSQAREQILARLGRTPLEVAGRLAAVYGHELPQVVYIPAVAIIARLRLGELTGDATTLADVERIVQPYLRGEPTLGEKPTSSHLPGHLVFGELARLTGKPEYVALARRAADLGFDAGGGLLAAMPMHNEMSDSVFMGCAILAQTGRLTGEARYFQMALRHLRFMEALDLRPDGLYRHSPLDEAAWGRGNGFPALGLAWALDETPPDAPERAAFLDSYRNLMAALVERQDATGMWHQVVDREESYRELTSTSMIGYALSRGLRNGWIAGERYERARDRAWYGVKTRVADDGSLVDVCTGTGKQPDLRAYLDREAILGPDARGGAMALLFAVEMAGERR